jgi:hypothetical protein
VLLGVVSPAEHVFEAPLGGDRLGSREPRAGVRDQADPGEDLIRLDDDMVAAVDALDPRRPIAERPIDAGLPQIGRFEDVRVRRENQGSIGISFSPDHGQQLWQPAHRRQAVRVSDPCPAAAKFGLRSTWGRASPSRKRPESAQRYHLK